MIAIVTDSTAYLTSDEARRSGVGVVPESYSVTGRCSMKITPTRTARSSG